MIYTYIYIHVLTCTRDTACLSLLSSTHLPTHTLNMCIHMHTYTRCINCTRHTDRLSSFIHPPTHAHLIYINYASICTMQICTRQRWRRTACLLPGTFVWTGQPQPWELDNTCSAGSPTCPPPPRAHCDPLGGRCPIDDSQCWCFCFSLSLPLSNQ